MPIDTSSYYPEVPDGDREYGPSLNRPGRGLFGDPEPSEPAPAEAMSVDTRQRESVSADSAEESGKNAYGCDRRNDKDSGKSQWEITADWIGNILSWLLVPILMPVYGIIIIFGLSILDIVPMGTRLVFTSVVFGINVVIPLLSFFVMKKMGIVDDIGLNERKERLMPYIITILCMGGTFLFMYQKGAPLWVSMFFSGGAAAGLVNLLVNFRWKISAHAAGIAGVVALLIRIIKDGYPEPAIFTWLIIAIILSGMMGSARVWLGRHTVWQVLAGYAVGFCSVFFLTMIR